MSNAHFDLTHLIHHELEKREARLSRPQNSNQTLGFIEIHLDDSKATPWDRIGPAQRESLLAFIVSTEIEDAMSHAEADHKVYDALGEHRILGESKRGKGRITSTTKSK
jgi:hypothetical protein